MALSSPRGVTAGALLEVPGILESHGPKNLFLRNCIRPSSGQEAPGNCDNNNCHLPFVFGILA